MREDWEKEDTLKGSAWSTAFWRLKIFSGLGFQIFGVLLAELDFYFP